MYSLLLSTNDIFVRYITFLYHPSTSILIYITLSGGAVLVRSLYCLVAISYKAHTLILFRFEDLYRCGTGDAL